MDFGIIPDNVAEEKYSIHIYGNSIVKQAYRTLGSAVGNPGKDFVVINRAKFGSFFSKDFKPQVPMLKHPKDILFFSILGNEILQKSKHWNDEAKCHLLNPQLLSNTQIANLLEKTKSFLTTFTESFDARILFMGPIPRFLEKCCDLPSHALPYKHSFDKILDYFDKLKYLYKGICWPKESF